MKFSEMLLRAAESKDPFGALVSIGESQGWSVSALAADPKAPSNGGGDTEGRAVKVVVKLGDGRVLAETDWQPPEQEVAAMAAEILRYIASRYTGGRPPAR